MLLLGELLHLFTLLTHQEASFPKMPSGIENVGVILVLLISFIGQITGKFFDFLLRLRAALDLKFDDFPRNIFLLLVSMGIQFEEVGIHIQQVDLL